MNIEKDKFDSLVSEEKSTWLAEALYQEENEEWLDLSFNIAVKILDKLRSNKRESLFPGNQKELALALKCTPQYISKILKGSENLQLETITKVGNILGVKLLEVPFEELKTETVRWHASNRFSFGWQEYLAVDFDKKTRSKKMESAKIPYSVLREKFSYQSDVDNDPNSPLKVA